MSIGPSAHIRIRAKLVFVRWPADGSHLLPEPGMPETWIFVLHAIDLPGRHIASPSQSNLVLKSSRYPIEKA